MQPFTSPAAQLRTLLAAMQAALADLAAGRTPERMLEFAELRELVGFDQYDAVLRAHARGSL